MIDIFEKTLGVLPIPDEFAPVLAQAKEEYAREGVFFLQEEYILRLQQKTNAYPRLVSPLCLQARELAADADAALYTLFLYRAMQQRALFNAHLAHFDFPQKTHPLLAFFSFLPYIEELWDFLAEKGIPQDVAVATVQQFEACVYVFEERFDYLGMNKRYFDHMQGYVDRKFLNAGRLRYEIIEQHRLFVLERKKDGKRVLFLKDADMNAAGLYKGTPPVDDAPGFRAFFRECDGYFEGTPVQENGRCAPTSMRFCKNEWRLILQPGDTCISVHIPAPGPLTKELCDESYALARRLFAAHYPEISPKAFHCHSWMMAPELAEVMRPTSKVLEFQRPYLKYPAHTAGEDVLNFVFKLKFTSYADLPEETSLQRALKARYLAGGYLYEYCGIIPFGG